ncbi:MAG: gamma-glutamylcyclotransferase [Alphaproteobacteria bacterium]|jgi:cation transport protein ChaC|nr:gamma-glutamylcyclotransferase [Alphaproteobacteria bacterium]
MTAPNRIEISEPGGFWFFGYGSLMWDPPFPAAETQRARIYGYHRSFCINSETYRGTPEKPGLSLGLDRAGSCTGIAFRISKSARAEAIREIEAREMVDDPIYICRRVALHLSNGPVSGYALVVNHADRTFAGRLSFEETARRIAVSRGDRGPNIDYLANTVAHLDDMGIPEGHLHALLRRAQTIRRPR